MAMKSLEGIANELLSDSVEIAWMVVKNSKRGHARFLSLFTLEKSEMSIVCEHIYLAD